jgi:hypothetical protein
MQLAGDLLQLARGYGIDTQIFVEGKKVPTPAADPLLGLPLAWSGPAAAISGLPVQSSPAAKKFPGREDNWRQGVHRIADAPFAEEVAKDFARMRARRGHEGEVVDARLTLARTLIGCLQLRDGVLELDLALADEASVQLLAGRDNKEKDWRPDYLFRLPGQVIPYLHENFKIAEGAAARGGKRKSSGKDPVSQAIVLGTLHVPRGMRSVHHELLKAALVVRMFPPAARTLGSLFKLGEAHLHHLQDSARFELCLDAQDAGLLMAVDLQASIWQSQRAKNRRSMVVRMKRADIELAHTCGIYERRTDGFGNKTMDLIEVPVQFENGGAASWMELRNLPRPALAESRERAPVSAPAGRGTLWNFRPASGVMEITPHGLQAIPQFPLDQTRDQLARCPGLYRVDVPLPDAPREQAQAFATGVHVAALMAALPQPYRIWPGHATTTRVLAFISSTAIIDVPVERWPAGIRVVIVVPESSETVVVNVKKGLAVDVVKRQVEGPGVLAGRVVCEFEDMKCAPVRVSDYSSVVFSQMPVAMLEGDRPRLAHSIGAYHAVLQHLPAVLAEIVRAYYAPGDLQNAFEQLRRALGVHEWPMLLMPPGMRKRGLAAAQFGSRDHHDLERAAHELRESGLLDRSAAIPTRSGGKIANPEGLPAGMLFAAERSGPYATALSGAIQVLAQYYSRMSPVPDPDGAHAQ